MLDTETTLTAFLEKRKVALITYQQQLGLRTSGYSADTTKAVTIRQGPEVVGQLTGVSYWRSQNSGRGPNRSRKPSRAMVDAIKQWTKVKGINIPAYPIAAKIAREGIKVPNPHNPGGVLDMVLNAETLTYELKTVLRPVYGQQLRNALFSR